MRKIEILVKRIAKREFYTIGRLFINGKYFCDTLEDTDRGLTSDMTEEEIMSIKIKGKTAIPTGTYKVTLGVRSQKFTAPKYKKQYEFCNAYLPRLLDVPGYDGVLIHIGNTPEHTDGCLLVGENKVIGEVRNSTATFKKLYKEINQNCDITITIE